MVTIKLRGSPLYQWDTDRKVELRSWGDSVIDEVQFACMGDNDAITVLPYEEDGTLIANIPNALLTSGEKLNVYAVHHTENGERTYTHFTFGVMPRPMPSDYIYTEENQKTWEQLEKEISNLDEENQNTWRQFNTRILALENTNPDFNAHEGDVGYIMNRTHYVDHVGNVHKLDNKFLDLDWLPTDPTIVKETDLMLDETGMEGVYYKTVNCSRRLVKGETYEVTWNGEKYTCVAKGATNVYGIGNASLISGIVGDEVEIEDTGEPFYIFDDIDFDILYVVAKIPNVTLKIEHPNKIPEVFLPDDIGTNTEEDAKAFYITLTDIGDGNCTADKTPEEVVEAYRKGYTLVVDAPIDNVTNDRIYRGFYPLISGWVTEESGATIYQFRFELHRSFMGTTLTNRAVYSGNYYNGNYDTVIYREKDSFTSADASSLSDLSGRIDEFYGRFYEIESSLSEKVTSPSSAEVGQAVVVKAVDGNGKPTEWEAASLPEGGGGDLWEKIGEVTFKGKQLTITAIADGIVTVDQTNGTLPDNTIYVVHPVDYSAYGFGWRFFTTEVEGQYTVKNMDGVDQTPSTDYVGWIVDVPDATVAQINITEKYSYLKMRLTTPLYATHGMRMTWLCNEYPPFSLESSAYSAGGNPAEITVECEESPVDGFMYVKGSLKYERQFKNSSYDKFVVSPKIEAPSAISFKHYNGLVTIGTKIEVYGVKS